MSLHDDLGGELCDFHVALHLQQLQSELTNVERDLLLGAQPDLRKALEICATTGEQRCRDDFLLIQFLGREVVEALTQTRSASALSISF